ncbi:hypothetical protein GCM10027048_23890 [Hymenobacter coalescens]
MVSGKKDEQLCLKCRPERSSPAGKHGAAAVRGPLVSGPAPCPPRGRARGPRTGRVRSQGATRAQVQYRRTARLLVLVLLTIKRQRVSGAAGSGPE